MHRLRLVVTEYELEAYNACLDRSPLRSEMEWLPVIAGGKPAPLWDYILELDAEQQVETLGYMAAVAKALEKM